MEITGAGGATSFSSPARRTQARCATTSPRATSTHAPGPAPPGPMKKESACTTERIRLRMPATAHVAGGRTVRGRDGCGQIGRERQPRRRAGKECGTRQHLDGVRVRHPNPRSTRVPVSASSRSAERRDGRAGGDAARGVHDVGYGADRQRRWCRAALRRRSFRPRRPRRRRRARRRHRPQPARLATTLERGVGDRRDRRPPASGPRRPWTTVSTTGATGSGATAAVTGWTTGATVWSAVEAVSSTTSVTAVAVLSTVEVTAPSSPPSSSACAAETERPRARDRRTHANATPVPASSSLESLDKCCESAVSTFTSYRRRTSIGTRRKSDTERGAWSHDVIPDMSPCPAPAIRSGGQ